MVTLAEHLRERGRDALATLLRRRPDLATDPLPANVEELAARAEEPASIDRAVAQITLAAQQVLQVVACLPPGVADDILDPALPDDIGPADVVAVLDELEAAGLVWRHEGRIHCPSYVRTAMPNVAGLPLQAYDEAITLDHVKHAVRTLRATLTEGEVTGELPPWASTSRKAALMDELAGMLGAPGAAEAAVRGAPPDASVLLHDLLTGSRPIEVDHPLVHYRVAHRRSTQLAHRPAYADTPTYWLFERGLLLPVGEGPAATLPRELVLSWQEGRPVAAIHLEAPEADAGDVDTTEVDVVAAEAVTRLLDAVGNLLDAWAEDPPALLKDGGLGISVLRATAARLDRSVDDTARVVELAHLAGLVAPVLPLADGPGSVEPTSAARPWLAASRPRRWSRLATAWHRAATWPSRAGRALDGDAVVPAIAPAAPDPTAVAAREGALAVLLSLPPGRGADPEALAARVHWNRPADWSGAGVDPPTAIGWVGEELEALGLAALGALSTFGRALLTGDRLTAEDTLDDALPPVATTFTLQADLTAVVIGRLEHHVLTELRLLADVESTGVATTYRFSEASLRRALDAGRDAAAITEFLEQHAPKGVPETLRYLVTDVTRRHGHLTVTGVGAVLTGEDPAVLADAATHRGTRALGLRLIAPTIAVSDRPADEVMATLRAAGFLPVPGDGTLVPAPVAVARPESTGDEQAREPFAVPADEDGAIDAATARDHAAAILAGPPPRVRVAKARR